jgi:hypothetical protein
MARLIGVSWNKAASMCVDVNALVSTGFCPSNCKRVSDYFFCLSDTSETVTFMETSPPDVAPIVHPLLPESTLKICFLSQQDFH